MQDFVWHAYTLCTVYPQSKIIPSFKQVQACWKQKRIKFCFTIHILV